jgi:hydroxypyruvate isomerase
MITLWPRSRRGAGRPVSSRRCSICRRGIGPGAIAGWRLCRNAAPSSVDSVAIALAYAEALGARRLHVMAGVADPADPEHRAAYLESLDFAAGMAAEKGITLLIEPINGRDMPGYFLNDFDLAVDLLGALGRDNVRLQFDIYHRQILHGDVLTGLERLMPLIGHVQIASVPRRGEPGSGELDDFRVLKALDALGYRGFVGCEYRPSGLTLDGLDWLDRFGRA